MKVLFVCLGNICRSPAAEGVFLHIIEKKGLKDQFFVDSAGTSSFHAGERPDQRMRDHASNRGVYLPSKSRQIKKEDFMKFDAIVVMDNANYKNCMALASNEEEKALFQFKMHKLADYCPSFDHDHVPDPYYGGPEGFEVVLDMVTEGCENLLKKWE